MNDANSKNGIKQYWLALKAKIFRNKQELLMYIVFGVLTTAVNVGVFQLLLHYQINYLTANLIALVTAKVFAYLTNKVFVFKSRTKKVNETVGEMIRFGLARGLTGVIDYFGLIFMVEVLSLDAVISKYFLQVIVIVMNYILGKKMVFVSKKTNP